MVGNNKCMDTRMNPFSISRMPTSLSPESYIFELLCLFLLEFNIQNLRRKNRVELKICFKWSIVQAARLHFVRKCLSHPISQEFEILEFVYNNKLLVTLTYYHIIPKEGDFTKCKELMY